MHRISGVICIVTLVLLLICCQAEVIDFDDSVTETEETITTTISNLNNGSSAGKEGYEEDAGVSWNSTLEDTNNSPTLGTNGGRGSWVDVVLDSTGYGNSSHGDLSNSLLKIFLPIRYSKHIIPNGSARDSAALLVNMSLTIHEVVDVDIKNERVKLDMDITNSWIDYNVRDHIRSQESLLKALDEAGIRYISFDGDFLKHVWKPDVSFEELVEDDTSHFLIEKIALSMRNIGFHTYFQLTTRRTLNLKCEMDFTYYPADTQKCIFNLDSYRYEWDLLNLTWDAGYRESVFLQTDKNANFDYQVCDVEPGKKLRTYQLSYTWGTKFSALTFSLKIRRNISYHLVQTYLPSVLLILITWLCFLLPPDMVECRVGVAMTTVLTLTAMFSSIREKSPEVSYTMAIDIWMVFCIFVVFLALVLFTLVYWLRRKSFQLICDANFVPSRSIEVDNTISKSSRRTKSLKIQIEQEGLKDIGSKKVEYFQLLAAGITKYAFALFALLFLTFLMAYTAWLILSSKYLEWEPSLEYNAGESGGVYRYVSEEM